MPTSAALTAVEQAAEGALEPAPPEQTVFEAIQEAEKDFFDFVNKERKRAARESHHLRVSCAVLD